MAGLGLDPPLPLLCPQVSGVINSYGVSSLLDEYEAGSRMWLFDRLTEWLDALAQAHPKRMFLLLADAGMGKSIFSAVAATKLLVRENKGLLVMVSGHACMARWG